MEQDEAQKVSRRAQRRAQRAAESEPEAAAAEVASDAESEDNEQSAEEAPQKRFENRKARRTAAAQARAARRQQQEEAAALGLDAGEMVDDALVRFTDKAARVVRRYWQPLQWIVSVGVIGWLGWEVFTWQARKANAEASDLLAAALAAEEGTIGDPELAGEPNENGVIDPTPVFETEEKRREAALEAYRKAAAEHEGHATAWLATVGEAGLLYETGKLDEALKAYQSVLDGTSAPHIQAAALEGKGLTLEAQGKPKEALAAFEALAKIPGNERLGLYQQARLSKVLGDEAAAKAHLRRLFELLGPPPAPSLGGLPEVPDFLRERAEQLALFIDPQGKEVEIPKAPAGAAAVQQMLDQLKAQGITSTP